MELTSSRIDGADFTAAQELYHSRGWTDGLPIIPPTPELVSACLDWALLPPEHLIGIEPVRERAITAEKLAINSVMAGCLPEHFPLVVASFTAMLQDDFLLHGATASTGGCAVLLIVNGPIRSQLGMDGSFNALGNTDRASSAIGRAVRLGLINLLDVRPGEIDRSTLGHPGKFSYCVAEDEENSSWRSLAEERLGIADISAVTAVAAMAPRQIMNEWTTNPEEICDTVAAEIRANQLHYSIWAGNYTVVLPGQLRQHFDDAGWSKADIRNYVHQQARVKRGEWTKVGKGSVVKDRADREYAAMESADQLLVVAAGGPAGGFAQIIPPWLGTKSRATTVAVGACVDCEVP
ncbi:MAG: hypothetical protein VX685_07395 [Actinomycetota bacterium]|nr:hypothetical protein [Acidimicrobiales bacterium]MEC8976887.1 hypothetical protein [Actinomycetota bacterium]MED6304850.1 hypothetical protein [Actinomycetota bacterium]